MPRYQRKLLTWILSASFLLIAGCGGGVSNKEMLERARAAKAARGDAEEDAPQKNIAPPPTPVANAAPANTGAAKKKEEIPTLPPAESIVPVTLTGKQREEKTIENLTRISKALEAYAKQHKAYPPIAIYSGPNPLLSWRVAILPYLGYEDLYKNFNLEEPWDSDHNLQLLPYIPEPFRSPSRADFKTNYLVPHGTVTVFTGPKFTNLDRIEDGVSNTVILAETTDKLAVEWTRPVEWKITPQDLVSGVASDVADGFYVAWGGGRISKLRSDLTDAELYAIVSIDGSEIISLSDLVAMDENDKAADLIDRGQADLTKADSNNVATKADAGEVSSTEKNPKTEPSESSSETYLAAVEAMSKGNEHQAFELYYASLLLESNADVALNAYHWIPALKRPASCLRWGIAVDSTLNERIAQDPDPIKMPDSTNAKKITGAGSDLVDHYCGDVGQKALSYLDQRIESGQFGSFLAGSTGTAKTQSSFSLKKVNEEGFIPVMLRPGIDVLGVGARGLMVKAARKRDLDVLLLFDVSLKRVSNGAVHNTTTILLLDVQSGQAVYETKPLNNIAVGQARKDATKEDPMLEELRSLAEFVDAGFSPGQMPELLPAHVQSRIGVLLKSDSWNPLKNMAEVRFYLAQGLISGYEAMTAIKDLAGDEADHLPSMTKDLTMEHLQRWISSEEE